MAEVRVILEYKFNAKPFPIGVVNTADSDGEVDDAKMGRVVTWLESNGFHTGIQDGREIWTRITRDMYGKENRTYAAISDPIWVE